LVQALINVPAIGERHIILLIDTGASVTTLLDGDAGRFRITIDYARKNLKSAPRKVVGIGGMAETYIIEGVKLMLTSEEGMDVGETLNLCVVLHDPSMLSG